MKKITNKLVIIDLHPVLHVGGWIQRVYNGRVPVMHKGNMMSVSLLAGGTYHLARLLERYCENDIIVASDFPPYKRKELYPEYKENRKRGRTEEGKQLFEADKALSTALLEMTGTTLHQKLGYEADDVIGKIVNDYYNVYDEIVIASEDSDLRVLLSDKVRQVGVSKRFVEKPFEKDVDELTSLDKAIYGDKGDNIPGIGEWSKNITDSLYRNPVGMLKNKKAVYVLIDLLDIPIFVKERFRLNIDLTYLDYEGIDIELKPKRMTQQDLSFIKQFRRHIDGMQDLNERELLTLNKTTLKIIGG